MPAWDPAEYGQTWAALYDEVHDLADDTAAAVAALTDRLADGARVLELGAGTGRLAIPLAAAGLQVVGLDASERMLQRLQAKPGGEAVTTVHADMVAPPVAGPFDCVLIAFNTLFALSTQAEQIACLTACAALLAPRGEVVLDLAVPQPWRLRSDRPSGEVVGGQVAMEVGDHDPVTQTIRSAKVLITPTDGIRTLPLRMRYAYPPELDLMARIAGLQLVSRAAGWGDEPFDRDSTRHVSVYRHLPLPSDPPQDH